jgi:predicted transcriptional regulator
MNASEIKLDLFRRLDSLDNSRLERVYSRIINLINADNSQKEELSPEIKTALDEALESSKQGRVYTHDEVMQKTKAKFPNLFK